MFRKLMTASTPTTPNPSADEDLLLVARAKAGDASAFRRLVEKHLPRVIGVARAYTRRRNDAEDIAQETWWKVHRKLDTFRDGASFTAWLYRVTVNCAADWIELKGNRRHTDVEEFERLPVADAVEAPLTSMARSEFAKAIRDAISELPEPFRSALVLREIEGLTYEEIAEIMGTPVGTIESRLFRARARLKSILEERGLRP